VDYDIDIVALPTPL